MHEAIKFSLADLRHYFLVDFAQGKPFAPGFGGSQLTERDEMDFQGAPALRHDFVNHMDRTSYGLCIPYDRMAAIFDGMARSNPETFTDHHLSDLHRTGAWWAFERRNGVTTEVYAERRGVHERTVRRWRREFFQYVEKKLKSPVVELVIPQSLRPDVRIFVRENVR